MINFEDDDLLDRFVGLRLWRAGNAWSRAANRTLAPLGLTQVQFLFLWALGDLGHDSGTSQARLASRLGIDVMTASQVLRRLEAKGLVERRHDEVDGRARSIHLTAEGADSARRAAPLMAEVDRDFFANPSDDLGALAAALIAPDPAG